MRRFAVLALPFLVIACGGQSAAPPAATSAAPYAVERLKPAGSPLESRFVGQVEGLEETVITARTGAPWKRCCMTWATGSRPAPWW